MQVQLTFNVPNNMLAKVQGPKGQYKLALSLTSIWDVSLDAKSGQCLAHKVYTLKEAMREERKLQALGFTVYSRTIKA